MTLVVVLAGTRASALCAAVTDVVVLADTGASTLLAILTTAVVLADLRHFCVYFNEFNKLLVLLPTAIQQTYVCPKAACASTGSTSEHKDWC